MRENKRMSQGFDISNKTAEFAAIQKFSDHKENQHPYGRASYRHDDNSHGHGTLPPLTSNTHQTPQMIQRQHKHIMVSNRPPQLISTQLRPAMYHRNPRPPPARLPPLDDQNHLKALRTSAIQNHMRPMLRTRQESYCVGTEDHEKSGVNPPADVIITEGDKGYRYNINPNDCLKQDMVEKMNAATQEAKAAPTKCTSRPTVATIQKVINCPDAPLLPGRREPIVPHPPADPKPQYASYNTNAETSAKVGSEKDTHNEKENKTEKSSDVQPKNKNIFVCHPPDKPRIGGAARRKWRRNTIYN